MEECKGSTLLFLSSKTAETRKKIGGFPNTPPSAERARRDPPPLIRRSQRLCSVLLRSVVLAHALTECSDTG